jgi:hypothetical protein
VFFPGAERGEFGWLQQPSHGIFDDLSRLRAVLCWIARKLLRQRLDVEGSKPADGIDYGLRFGIRDGLPAHQSPFGRQVLNQVPRLGRVQRLEFVGLELGQHAHVVASAGQRLESDRASHHPAHPRIVGSQTAGQIHEVAGGDDAQGTLVVEGLQEDGQFVDQ